MNSLTKKPNLAEITKATAGKTKTSGISPFSELEITKVYPNPDQPRKAFEDIEELAATIQQHGLLQPITVVKKDDGYMIVSGERRYKAHLFNEAKTIKAYILDATDEKVEELTLIENIQRNDLTDFEIANHIVKLWKTGRYAKKSDLAKKVGKSESYVSKAFSSLNLDDEILEDIAVNKKDISISVMDEISRVKDKKVQKEVYQKYNAGEITRDNIKEFKEPIGLKTQYFGTFSFVYNYRMLTQLNFLLDGRCYDPFSENKTYYCMIEQINKEQEIIQSPDNLQFTLKTTKKKLNVLKELGNEWIKISNSLSENKIYRFWIELSRYQKNTQEPKSEKEETNIALEKYEDAEKDLVDQAKNFTHNFPTGNLEATFKVDDLVQDKTEILEAKSFKENFFQEKSYSEELNDANKLENQFTQLIEEGYRSPHPKIKLNNAYEIIIYRLLLQKSSKEVDHKFNKINTWLNKNDGRIQNSSKGKLLLSDGCCTSLDNRYDEIIFDLLKENLELKKELHNLKENQTVQDNSILEDKKEIALLELFSEAVTINYTNYDIDMGIDYQKAKKIIDKSKQESIPFNVGKGTDERVYRLINTDVRTIKDDCIVFIDKKEDDAKRSN